MPSPKIAMLFADHDTQNALRAWAERQGFDLTTTHGGRSIPADQFGFHITLLATANPIYSPATDHMVSPITVETQGFGVLGQDDDVPVIEVDAEGPLQSAREFFIDVYGAEPTFEDFKPHVSLSYAWDGTPDLADLDLPSFPLVFDRLVIQDFEPEHKSVVMCRARPAPGAHAVYR